MKYANLQFDASQYKGNYIPHGLYTYTWGIDTTSLRQTLVFLDTLSSEKAIIGTFPASLSNYACYYNKN